MERLVYWNLLETTLKERPLERNQHAFRTGFGTETALSEAVNIIEKGVLKGNYALGVFLDVSGAFDHLSFKAAKEAMKRKGIDPKITA